MRMLTGKRDKGNCKLPALTDEEFERLAKWFELGVLFRYNGDGQVWTPFGLKDQAQRVDPILKRRGFTPTATRALPLGALKTPSSTVRSGPTDKSGGTFLTVTSVVAVLAPRSSSSTVTVIV